MSLAPSRRHVRGPGYSLIGADEEAGAENDDSPTRTTSASADGAQTRNVCGIERPRLLAIGDAPAYVTSNTHIRTGYRAEMSSLACIASVFTLHNETGNIWTHLVACLANAAVGLQLLGLVQRQGAVVPFEAGALAAYVCAGTLAFAASAIFHTFLCHSRRVYLATAVLDYMGIAVLLCGAFMPGLAYGFVCAPRWQAAYVLLVGAMGLAASSAQVLPVCHRPGAERLRLVLFVSLGAFGLMPCLHWVALHGAQSEAVLQLGWRMAVLFVGLACACAIYVGRLPECLAPGRFDVLGQSHQLWHVLVALLYLWHLETAVQYREYLRASGLACQQRAPG